MESFLGSKSALTGYICEIPPEQIHELWKPHMENKEPLEFIAKNSFWTVEMTYHLNSPVFNLALGFTANEDIRWKSLRNVVLIDITILRESILLDVVNSSNGSIGILVIRLGDRMSFCTKRLVKNSKFVPTAYQCLMHEAQAECEANAGDFNQTARIVKKYLADSMLITNAKLTKKNSVQGKGIMEQEKRGQKKKRPDEASPTVATRSRPPPLSALDAAAESPRPPAMEVLGRQPPIVSLSPQPEAPNETAGRVKPTARPKIQTKKRKAIAASAPSESTASPEEGPQRWHTKKRKQPAPSESEGSSSSSEDDARNPSSTQETVGPSSTQNTTQPSSTQEVTDSGRVTEEEAQKLAYKKVNGTWVDNPVTVPFRREDVPDQLFVDLDFKHDPKRSEEANMRLRLKAEAVANKKYRELSDYMYIFGRGTYFQLDLADMTNADEKTGVIVRPLEAAGVFHVLKKMVKLNYNKQILTVMPATNRRPTCWEDCVKAGPFIIIDGQHSWSAAKEILSGETPVDDPAVIDSIKSWTCEVVWTETTHHLHSLSSKCNDGNVSAPFLSSLSATIQHCRYLWDYAKRPLQSRKNKKNKELDEECARYEDFKAKVQQSFEATGTASKQNSSSRQYDFDRMGERRIIMSSERTWSAWKTVFQKHEKGELHDIDSGGMFSAIKNLQGETKTYKFVPMNSNQMKSLLGMDDGAVYELSQKILSTPPKVYLNKRPTKWCAALPFAAWCNNKKTKTVLIRLIVDHALDNGMEGATGVFTKSGAVVPDKWRSFKQELCLRGFHMWVLEQAGLDYIKSQLKHGGNKDEVKPKKKLEVLVKQAVSNSDRFERIYKSCKPSLCRWKNASSSFERKLFVNRRNQWSTYESDGPSNPKFCEAGIMDFRQFPMVKDMEINCGHMKLLQEINEISKGAMSKTVNTWMVICNANKAALVELTLNEILPNHKLRREAKYVYSKGEPSYALKNKDKVLYFQRVIRGFTNSRSVDTRGTIPKLSEEEDVDLVNDHKFFKTREICRHDNPPTISSMELRYEVYLRFIDKFCRDQGTVMLVFAGAKPISACGMLGRSSVSFLPSTNTCLNLFLMHQEIGPKLWPENLVPGTPGLRFNYHTQRPGAPRKPVVNVASSSVDQETDVPHNVVDPEAQIVNDAVCGDGDDDDEAESDGDDDDEGDGEEDGTQDTRSRAQVNDDNVESDQELGGGGEGEDQMEDRDDGGRPEDDDAASTMPDTSLTRLFDGAPEDRAGQCHSEQPSAPTEDVEEDTAPAGPLQNRTARSETVPPMSPSSSEESGEVIPATPLPGVGQVLRHPPVVEEVIPLTPAPVRMLDEDPTTRSEPGEPPKLRPRSVTEIGDVRFSPLAPPRTSTPQPPPSMILNRTARSDSAPSSSVLPPVRDQATSVVRAGSLSSQELGRKLPIRLQIENLENDLLALREGFSTSQQAEIDRLRAELSVYKSDPDDRPMVERIENVESNIQIFKSERINVDESFRVLDVARLQMEVAEMRDDLPPLKEGEVEYLDQMRDMSRSLKFALVNARAEVIDLDDLDEEALAARVEESARSRDEIRREAEDVARESREEQGGASSNAGGAVVGGASVSMVPTDGGSIATEGGSSADGGRAEAKPDLKFSLEYIQRLNARNKMRTSSVMEKFNQVIDTFVKKEIMNEQKEREKKIKRKQKKDILKKELEYQRCILENMSAFMESHGLQGTPPTPPLPAAPTPNPPSELQNLSGVSTTNSACATASAASGLRRLSAVNPSPLSAARVVVEPAAVQVAAEQDVAEEQELATEQEVAIERDGPRATPAESNDPAGDDDELVNRRALLCPAPVAVVSTVHEKNDTIVGPSPVAGAGMAVEKGLPLHSTEVTSPPCVQLDSPPVPQVPASMDVDADPLIAEKVDVPRIPKNKVMEAPAKVDAQYDVAAAEVDVQGLPKKAPPPVPSTSARKSPVQLLYFVVLEVEGVLCHVQHVGKTDPDPGSSEPSEADYDPSRRHVFGEYTLYCRPHVRFFLSGLARRFRLAIWTRLPAEVAKPVVRFLFRDKDVSTLTVLTLEDCTTLVERRAWWLCKCPPRPYLPVDGCPAHPVHSEYRPPVETDTFVECPEHPGGVLRLKVLHKVVWGDRRFISKKFTANSTNTLLVDSSPESSILNPCYNAVYSLRYMGGEEDVFLKDSLSPYLKGLLESGRSVCQYLSENPPCFGQLEKSWFQSYYGMKVFRLARYYDRDLVREYLDSVFQYSNDKSGPFAIRKRPG